MNNKCGIGIKVNEIAREYWGTDFNLPVDIVDNIHAHGGFGGKPDKNGNLTWRMELSKGLILDYPEEIIEGVIKHELCHWALLIQGKANDDDDIEFYLEMQRVGGLFPNQIPRVGLFHIAKCIECGEIIGAETSESYCKEKIKTEGLVSLCCNAPLKYAGRKYINELLNN